MPIFWSGIQTIKVNGQKPMVCHQISLLRQQLRKKVGTLNAVDEFLKDIAGSSSPSDLLPILHALPDSDPSPDEQIKK